MKTVLLLAALLLIPTSSDAMSPEDDVRAVIDALFDAMRESDEEGVLAVFHENARLMTATADDGAPIVRETRIADFAAAVGGSPDEVWDEPLFNVDIRVDDGLASAWMNYRFYRNGDFSHCGSNAVQLVKTMEGWQIMQIIDTRRTERCDFE